MRTVILITTLFVSALVLAGEDVTIHGVLSFNKNGIAVVEDCESGRKLELGTMASAPYFKLIRQYEKLSQNGSPTIAFVKGVIKNNKIANPVVMKLVAGKCNESAI